MKVALRWRPFRPLNGWRAFAGEIGVVTLGVLIALLAQQAAEALNWRGKVADSRSALRRELAMHYLNAIEWRLVEPCIAAQLDALEARLATPAGTLRPVPAFREDGFVFAVRVPSREYPASIWQGVLAEGVSSHLASTERALFASHYSSSSAAGAVNTDFERTTSRLNVMTKPLPLDPGVRLSLLVIVAEAREANALLGVISGQAVDQVLRLKMAPPAATRAAWLASSGTRRFCRARGLPMRSAAEAQQPLS